MQVMEKVIREKEFHNEWARSLDIADIRVRESFEAGTAIENRFALQEMGDLRDKKMLDLGCGAGETSVYFALQGAKVWACDVSEEFLKVARSVAGLHGVELRLIQMDAARMPFRKDFFDFVFGNGVLHHADLLPAGREIQRVLKKGGKAIFVEPLPYNPIINVYRAMAKAVRSEDERPLSFRQLRELRPLFSSYRHREFWLFSLLIFIHFYFVKRWHPGRVRYWKKVIDEAKVIEKPFAFLQKIDEFALKYFPLLGFLCWNTVLVLKK